MPNHDHLKINTYQKRRLANENDSITLKTTLNIKSGEQIYVDYGRDENERLLCDYGFTIEHNPFLPNGKELDVKVNNQKFKVNLNMRDTKNLIDSVDSIRKDILKANNKTKSNDNENRREITKEILKAIIS